MRTKRNKVKKVKITDLPPGYPKEKLLYADTNTKTYIGIDPGKIGFICAINGVLVNFYPIPKIGKQVDLLELCKIFEQYKEVNCHCVMEDVHAIYGSAAGATFEFGRIVGSLESLLVAFKIPHTKVAPKKWQKEMWEGVSVQKKASASKKTMVIDTKSMSEVAAKRLFPNIDLRKSTRAKNADDNKVDSLLMAEYCKRNF